MNKIIKKNKRRNNMNKNKNKDKKGLPITASHLVLYISLIAYFLIIIFGIIIITYCAFLYPEYLTEMLISLFSFTGVIGSVSIGFYEYKAKSENEALLSSRKYEKRLELAMDIFNKISKGELSPEGISLAKVLISDSDTNIITNDFGGTSVIEHQTYKVPSSPLKQTENKEDFINENDIDNIPILDDNV